MHDFLMARIYKNVVDTKEWFGKDKKGFKSWKEGLLSFSGTIVDDRMLRYYGEIFKLLIEYEWLIYYPYSTLYYMLRNTRGEFKQLNSI